METQKQMTHFEIVQKLIGPIMPIGESNEDARRHENLRDMLDLLDQIYNEVNKVAIERHSLYSSVKKSGEFAHGFLKELNYE